MGRWLITTLMLASSSLPFGVTLAGRNSRSPNGVTGQILLGPTCPVARPGDAKCKDQPYETTMIIKTVDGKRVTELRLIATETFASPCGQAVTVWRRPKAALVIHALHRNGLQ